MKVKHHLISSGVISSVVYLVTNSPVNAVTSFAAGVFIDLDHLFDYYANFGFTYRLKEIYRALADVKLKKVYLFLHSIELLIVFWVFIFLIPLKSIYLAVAIGMTQHVFFDFLYNPVIPRGYFLFYRINKNFMREFIIDQSKIKE